MRREDVINAGDWEIAADPVKWSVHGVHKVQSLSNASGRSSYYTTTILPYYLTTHDNKVSILLEVRYFTFSLTLMHSKEKVTVRLKAFNVTRWGISGVPRNEKTMIFSVQMTMI